MTGFARSHGASGPYAFEWELKSVNAKGFDLRMRLPPGWDDLEAFAKKRAGEVLSRGTVYANLNIKRSSAVSTAVTSASESCAPHGVCLPNASRYQSLKFARPTFAAILPSSSYTQWRGNLLAPSTSYVDVPSARQLNQQLHGERIFRGSHRRRLHRLPWGDLW